MGEPHSSNPNSSQGSDFLCFILVRLCLGLWSEDNNGVHSVDRGRVTAKSHPIDKIIHWRLAVDEEINSPQMVNKQRH